MEAHLRRQREQHDRELAAKKAAEQRWHQAPAFKGTSFAGLRKENGGRSWAVQTKEERSAGAPSARAAAGASAGSSKGASAGAVTGAPATARAGFGPVRVGGKKAGPVQLNKPLFNGHGFMSRAELHKRAEQDARKAAEEALHKPRQTGGGRYSVFRAKAKSAPVPDLRRAPNVPAAATSFMKRVSRRISRRFSSSFMSEPSKAQAKQQLVAVQEVQEQIGEEEEAAASGEGEHEEEETKAAEPEPAGDEPAEEQASAVMEEASTEAAAEVPPQEEEEAEEVKPEPLAAKH
jgi:hypothetical protein